MTLDAERAVREGASPYLAGIAAERALDVEDIAEGARQGDPACSEIALRAADALFSPGYLVEWGPHGSPLQTPDLVERLRQV